MKIQKQDWEWFGSVAHFIQAQWCRFHLATKVGSWLIATIGEYVHPRHAMGSEQKEMAWLKKNWPGEDIGYGRKYETMVFRCGQAVCWCGCGLPLLDDWSAVEMAGCNTAKEARENHLAMCEKYSEIEPEEK